MSLDDWRIIFISICNVLIISACVPLIIASLPNKNEPFFALAVLGEEGIADNYYPEDNLNIEIGDEVSWTIYLYNHMGETKYVAVRIKLINSTMMTPNSTLYKPSSAPINYEIRRILLNNETWLCPFSWSIQKIEFSEGYYVIKQLIVNDRTIETYVNVRDGSNIRFILELWLYEKDLEDFQFRWRYDDEMGCVWNQVWFNITSMG